MVKYPVGEQSFENLRNEGFLYVDKTRYIEQLIHGSKYYFLGRPRRFGKSLLLSAIKCFFEGKRELFKGLYIDSIDWNWDQYPVLYLDINAEKYLCKEDLERILRNHLEVWETQYGRLTQTESLSLRFANVIQSAYLSTGHHVVVLVDEYDKPLVNSLHDRELYDYFRALLGSVYASFKSAADYLRFVLLTGVSRFGKVSIFSGLNNLNDLSFDDAYANICGITERELLDNFKEGIQELAIAENIAEAEIVDKLRRYYDGYRFSIDGDRLYNPFSLLNVMSKKRFANYWIESGTPTLLLKQLKRFNLDVESVVESIVPADQLMGLDLDNANVAALMYQTGYVTIKDYGKEFDEVRLGLPNLEVKRGFMTFLLPYYSSTKEKAPFRISQFIHELEIGDAQGFMSRLQSMLSDIPYEMEMECERNVQNAFYILAVLAGTYVKAEYHTSCGRIDLLFKSSKYIYIIELKFDGTAEDALRQINSREYSLPFSKDARKLIKIGANYSSKRRTLDEWRIEIE